MNDALNKYNVTFKYKHKQCTDYTEQRKNIIILKSLQNVFNKPTKRNMIINYSYNE